MRRTGTLIVVTMMVLSSVAMTPAVGASTANGVGVQVDPTPTDPNDADSTHAVRMTVGNSAVAGGAWKNVFVDYSVGARPADVSNVGSGTVERIGIDRGNDDPGTQIDVSATVNSVTGLRDGKAVKLQTNGNLTLRQGDEVVVVLNPVQNPQNAGNSQISVTVNHQLDPSINATTTTTYEYNNASVEFANQETAGDAVTVDRVELSEGGFVAVSNKSGRNPSAVRGVSDYLGPGVHEDVTVTLDQPLENDTTLYAIAHTDENANRLFDYADSGGEWDVPYLDRDGNVMGQSSAELTVTAGGSGDVSVAVDSTNSPVEPGETLEVTATAENTGNAEASETIGLEVDGTQRDSSSVTLAPGESSQVTLTWNTSEGDTGDYTATVTGGGASASVDVAVGTGDGDDGTDGDGSPVTRSVADDAVDVGNSTSTTVDVDVGSSYDRLTVVERVSPAVGNLTLTNVEIDGDGTVVATAEGSDLLGVAISGVSADTTVSVSYEVVTTPALASADQLEFTSEVTGDGEAIAVETSVVDVEGGLSAYDLDDDGTIENGELNEAVADWAGGDVSIGLLQEVIAAWATQETVGRLQAP